MRRALLALALALSLLADSSLADDTKSGGWKWDATKKATPKVGNRIRHEESQDKKQDQTVSMGGNVVQKQKVSIKLDVVYVVETISVEGKQATEEVVKVEKFKLVKNGEDPDTSLEGHTVRVKTKDGKSTYVIEDDKEDKVSDEAKDWIDSELASKKKKKDGEEDDNPFRPKEPVAPETEFSLDLEKLVKAFRMTEVPKDAKATGKLTKVTEKEGCHFGHVDMKVSLPFVNPGMEWKKGGVMEMTVTFDGSLEEDKSAEQEFSYKIAMAGTGEAAGPQGKATVEMDIVENRSGKQSALK